MNIFYDLIPAIKQIGVNERKNSVSTVILVDIRQKNKKINHKFY